MRCGIVTALLGLVYTLVPVNAISLDLEITKKIEQAIKKDDFVISVKDIKPKKQTKYAVETLFVVDFPGARHKLALMLDRGTKKVIVETLEDGWKRTQHIIDDTLHDENTIRSLILAINQTKPAAHVSLYIDCIFYGIVATPKPMRDMLSSMKNPKIEVFREREYHMKVDDDINLGMVLSRNGCPASSETEVFNKVDSSLEDDLNNDLNDDPNVPTLLVAEGYDRADVPINTLENDAILTSLNTLIRIVNVEVRKCEETARAIEDIRRLIENCDLCRNRRTCATHPPTCFPGVECRDTEYGPRCGICPPRYTGNGEQCSPVSRCSENNPCFHGVTCRDSYYGLKCDPCPPGYEGNGITCTPTTPRPVLKCSQRNPCFHGVICTDGYYGPECGSCPHGYEGDGITCTPTTPRPVLKCSQRNPCFHGVTCRDGYYGPECESCPPGYEGDGITCTPTTLDPCPVGYERNGISCIPITPRPVLKCSQRNPCFPGVTCSDGYYGPECGSCPSGHEGNGVTCTPTTPRPVLKCSQRNPCFHGVICRDGYYGPECESCPPGYEGDGITCTPTTLDPCPAGYERNGISCIPITPRPVLKCSQRNPCFPGVTCSDGYYGPECGSCPPGHEGDGITCTPTTPRPVPTCSMRNPCFSGVICRDGRYGPECESCPPGYEGDGINCTHITPPPVKCSQRNPCFPGVVCTDGYYGPECGSCPPGYKGNGIKCITSESQVNCSFCFPGVSCRIGFYGPECGVCPPGYEGDGKTCTSICDHYPNPCSSGKDCIPIAKHPFYTCGCHEGSKWDGRNCIDIDECEVAKPCDPLVECTNLNPGYRCGPCPWGYTGSLGVHGVGIDFATRNKQRCVDIDECADESTCFPRECINTEGSYTCGCKLVNDTCEWHPRETCPSGIKCSKNAKCIHLDYGQYACKCVTGWAGNGEICGKDTDLDSWPDENLSCSDSRCVKDNCPRLPNSGQEDADGDFKGDVCDTNSDNDDVHTDDNCPFHYNPDQGDTDEDKIGDVCDNCPLRANPDQSDIDEDGKGDLCDEDIDGDGVLNEYDNCAKVANPEQKDSDSDGIGDACDNCINESNQDQRDLDQNFIGDVCDSSDDQDRDGVPDTLDNCIDVPNPNQLDTDKDGQGNECDDDDDDDGIIDVLDNCPLAFNPDQAHTNGNSSRGSKCMEDNDLDGIDDYKDNCPNNSLVHKTDFRRYQKVALDSLGESEIDPNWEIYDHGSEIVETLNSDPGLAVGPDVLHGVDYEGTFFVDTDIDDDIIGIVFSYQSNKKFYTVMWKKNAQTYWQPEPFRAFAEPGIQIKVVNSVTGPSQLLRNSLWHNHNVTNQVSILWKDPKNVGWKSRTPYRWFLLHRPSIGLIRLKIFEGEHMITDSGNIFDSTLKGGHLGVLCFSQEMVVWSDLAYRCTENLNEEIWSELTPSMRSKIDVESTRS